MRHVGFSTGAVAYSNFARALDILAGTSATAVELSALRQHELKPLVDAIPTLPLSRYGHISVHLPSKIEVGFEDSIFHLLREVPRSWLLVVHPNIINDYRRWVELGPRLCIENMDKRKPIGQSAADLIDIFRKLPEATLCFDIGHAHQVDPTMGEAVFILESFSDRIRQLHVSEVNSDSKHDPISKEALVAFSEIAGLIPAEVPAVLETRITQSQDIALARNEIDGEIDLVQKLLSSEERLALAGD